MNLYDCKSKNIKLLESLLKEYNKSDKILFHI